MDTFEGLLTNFVPPLLSQIAEVSRWKSSKLKQKEKDILELDLDEAFLQLEEVLHKLPSPHEALTLSHRALIIKIREIFSGIAVIFDVRLKKALQYKVLEKMRSLHVIANKQTFQPKPVVREPKKKPQGGIVDIDLTLGEEVEKITLKDLEASLMLQRAAVPHSLFDEELRRSHVKPEATVAEVPDAIGPEVPDALVAEVPDTIGAEMPDAIGAEVPDAIIAEDALPRELQEAYLEIQRLGDSFHKNLSIGPSTEVEHVPSPAKRMLPPQPLADVSSLQLDDRYTKGLEEKKGRLMELENEEIEESSQIVERRKKPEPKRIWPIWTNEQYTKILDRRFNINLNKVKDKLYDKIEKKHGLSDSPNNSILWRNEVPDDYPAALLIERNRDHFVVPEASALPAPKPLNVTFDPVSLYDSFPGDKYDVHKLLLLAFGYLDLKTVQEKEQVQDIEENKRATDEGELRYIMGFESRGDEELRASVPPRYSQHLLQVLSVLHDSDTEPSFIQHLEMPCDTSLDRVRESEVRGIISPALSQLSGLAGSSPPTKPISPGQLYTMRYEGKIFDLVKEACTEGNIEIKFTDICPLSEPRIIAAMVFEELVGLWCKKISLRQTSPHPDNIFIKLL